MASAPTYHREKLEELVLYIALRMEGNDTFGRTKLAKILFFSDFAAFVRLGAPITGATYRKLEFGPCPREFPEVERRLTGNKRAHLREVAAGPFEQKRLVALEAPNLDVFTAAEIAIVDEIMERFRNGSATDLSELSHRFSGWRLATIGEEIPYFTAAIPNEPLELSPDEMAWAKAEVRRLGG